MIRMCSFFFDISCLMTALNKETNTQSNYNTFLFLKFDLIFWKSTPTEFAYIWQIGMYQKVWYTSRVFVLLNKHSPTRATLGERTVPTFPYKTWRKATTLGQQVFTRIDKHFSANFIFSERMNMWMSYIHYFVFTCSRGVASPPVGPGLQMFGLIILPLIMNYALLGWANKLKSSKC